MVPENALLSSREPFPDDNLSIINTLKGSFFQRADRETAIAFFLGDRGPLFFQMLIVANCDQFPSLIPLLTVMIASLKMQVVLHA